MFDSLLEVISSSPWTYGVVFLFAYLDVIVTVVPSETAVITASALAASGDLNIALVILAAAVGAMLGDNCGYAIGHWLQRFVRGRLFSGSRRRHLDRAERALQERGGYLIIIGRFIPGGRTAVTVASGVLHYPWRRFVVYDVAAAFIWALYAGMIGYIGGKVFADDPLMGILLALGIALTIASVSEGYRYWKRRGMRPPRSPAAGEGADRG